MWEFISSMFGALEDGSALESVKGVGRELGSSAGVKALGSDGSMMKGVKSALMIAGGHGQKAHSQSNATPFHYQSNANLDTTLNHEASYMKNDINVGQGFNSLKGLF